MGKVWWFWRKFMRNSAWLSRSLDDSEEFNVQNSGHRSSKADSRHDLLCIPSRPIRIPSSCFQLCEFLRIIITVSLNHTYLLMTLNLVSVKMWDALKLWGLKVIIFFLFPYIISLFAGLTKTKKKKPRDEKEAKDNEDIKQREERGRNCASRR